MASQLIYIFIKIATWISAIFKWQEAQCFNAEKVLK